MSATATSRETTPTFSAVPLPGLVQKDAVPFPLYLRTADDVWVLYHGAAAALDENHVGRLHAEGIDQLFIRDCDRPAYFQRIEGDLDAVLLDRVMPLERRVDVLHGVALHVAEDLLASVPDRARLQRAQKVMMATSGLLLRDNQGFAAVRRVLGASQGLAQHSLTIGFLAMGLSRIVLGADGGTMLQAGLAGLLHDVGKVGHEDLDHDPEHTTRGAVYLKGLGLPAPVVDAARSHHERHDGSGYPRGLANGDIPELARIVGIVDTFDKVYSTQRPKVGVFDALRILAQAYRGCFDERIAAGLVRLFR
ncbi:MAG: HD domain-containing protein [Planctomycetes bacterium]|nr:HD domain-containing protein [Planctomycetota bacterium]